MDKSLPDAGQLENRGFANLVPDGYVRPEERTYMVVGLARSGTTMVAKVLDSFGLFMGEGADNSVGEDTVLAKAIESHDRTAVAGIVERYDAAHPIWGFKRPNVFTYLNADTVEFRNPHFIVVLRDIFAIANRNYISTFRHPIDDMRESLGLLDELVSFIERNRSAPMFFLSYERALIEPRDFVIELGSFCGVDLSPRMIRDALYTITPGGGEGYLQGSRVDSFFGRITAVSASSVSGHFRYHRTTETPPLELFVNADPVETSVAWSFVDLARPSGRDFSGDFGFTLSITDGTKLSVGDSVDVIADDQRRQRLKNCPYRVRRSDLEADL